METREKQKRIGTKSPPVPNWVTAHFRVCTDSLEQLMQIIHVSERGISVLRAMPRVVKAIAHAEGKSTHKKTAEDLQRAEKEAVLAATEVEKDFPVLHGFAVVALWSWLENFTKGFVALWILHKKEALNAPALQKLRVKLADYLKLSRSEQAQLLVELLEQELASPLKRGSGRFESLLEPFNLTFPLPDGCQQQLFELQQIRNVIAHRNGRADRKFKTACPWIKTKIDHPVNVSREMLQGYSNAASEFLVQLLYRLGDLEGINLRPDPLEATES